MKLMLPESRGDHYVWPSLEVRTLKGKGDSVFATRDIPAFTFLPYIGPVFPVKMFPPSFLRILEDTPYVQESRWGRERVFIDGSPKFMGWNNIGCRGLAIAAKINEPDPNVLPNCIFYDEKTGRIPFQGALFAVTIRDIRQGTELLVCYGATYPRKYKAHPVCATVQKLEGKDPLYGGLSEWMDAHSKDLYQYRERILDEWKMHSDLLPRRVENKTSEASKRQRSRSPPQREKRSRSPEYISPTFLVHGGKGDPISF